MNALVVNTDCRAPVGTRLEIERLASGNWLGTITVGEIVVEREEPYLMLLYSRLLNSWWKERHGEESGDRRQETE